MVPDGERIALGDIELDEDGVLVLGDDGVALDVVREVEEVELEADCVKEGLNKYGFVLDVIRAVVEARLEADCVKLGLGGDEVALDAVGEVEEVKLEADCVRVGLGDAGVALDVVREDEEDKPEVDCAKAGLDIERARRKMIPALMLAMVKVKDFKRSRILHKM